MATPRTTPRKSKAEARKAVEQRAKTYAVEREMSSIGDLDYEI